jgi:hypothetical protein
LKRTLIVAGSASAVVALVVVLFVLRDGNSQANPENSSGKLHPNQGELHAYYLPRDTQCTVLVDFAGQRSELEKLDRGARNLELARQMVDEFRRHGEAKTQNARTVQLIAVCINGKDNYGRPDFANRTTFLKLSGSREQVLGLTDADLGDWEHVKHTLTAETD